MSQRHPRIAVLKKRPAFLAVAETRKKWVAPGLVLQVGPLPTGRTVPAQRDPAARPPLHYGITATRKVGNAVARNRARRRLRALMRDVMVPHAKRHLAYVLVARTETVTRDAAALRADLELALKRFHLWREGDADAATP